MKRNTLITGLTLLLLAPPHQESTGFLGIDWWVWILIGVALLLLLLIIGFVLQEEPGPPVPQRESKMYVTPASVGKAQPEPEPAANPEPVSEPELEPGLEPEPELEPVLEPEPELEPEKNEEVELAPRPENLERIEGIGPKVADLLKNAGITTFAALAETDVERLNQILDEADLQMMDASSWPQQAALAAAGDWEAFDKLTAELKGGRRET